jgi:hypothetical protein
MDIAVHDGVVEHAMRGRMRLRFRGRRGDVAFFEELVRTLSSLPEVDEVEATPETGSVLIRHSASPAQLGALAERLGLPTGGTSEAGRRQAADSVRRRADTSAPSLPALGLGSLAVYQTLRGRMLGSAAEQFWHAARASEFDAPLLSLWLFGLGLLQLVNGRILAPASTLFIYAFLAEAMKTRTPTAAGAGSSDPTSASPD